jgi:hypothetical protein
MSYTKVRSEHYNLTLYGSNNSGTFVQDTKVLTADDSFTGDYNPYWKSLVKRGLNATTGANGLVVNFDPDPLDFILVLKDKTNPNGADQLSSCFGDSIPYGYPNGFSTNSPPSSVVTDVTNRAIRKFLDDCNSARSSIEAGQDFGEYRETIRGLLHPLQSLREFTLSHLSRVIKLGTVVKHKKALSKMVADTFLEFKFGWNPLAADIGQAYADLVNNQGHQAVQTVNGSARDFWPVTNIVGVQSNSMGNFIARTNVLVTGSYSVHLKGGIRTDSTNGRIGVAQMLQLDLPHFVPTMWDLLPYSWIADYFVNVGEVINGLSFQHQNLAWGNKTIRCEYLYQYSNVMIDNFSTAFWTPKLRSTSGGNPSVSRVTFNRSGIQPDDLVPRVQFKLPLGSLKPWENMLALMVGRQSEFSKIARNLR